MGRKDLRDNLIKISNHQKKKIEVQKDFTGGTTSFP